MPRDNSWKNITYVAGAALGLVTGVAAAHLYTKAAEENGTDGKPGKIDTGDAFKIGLAAVTLVRQVSSLGAKK
jgi:hypothetical protein